MAGLLRDGPNGWTDTFTFVRDLVAEALIQDGGSATWVNRVNGRLVEVIHYDPGAITVERDMNGTREPSYRLHGAPIDARDVIHLQSPFGRAPASLARESIGLALTLDAHAARLFGNGARPSGVLALKDRVTPESLKRIRESWQIAHGGGRSGGTAILEGGAEYS